MTVQSSQVQKEQDIKIQVCNSSYCTEISQRQYAEACIPIDNTWCRETSLSCSTIVTVVLPIIVFAIKTCWMMIEEVIHFWWLSDITLVAAVGYHGNHTLLRTQAIHTWCRFFSVETEIQVICKSSKKSKFNYLTRFLPYWMMQPSVNFTWDLQKMYRADYKQLVEAHSLNDLPLLQESPHYVFSWNTIKNLQRCWTSLLMPCWTLQTGRNLSWTLRCECTSLATDLWPACEQTIFKRISHRHLHTRLRIRAGLPSTWRQPGLPGGRCRHRTKL